MWRIFETANTVIINDECAEEIFNLGKYNYFENVSDVAIKNNKQLKLSFNPDHGEHMDFVSNVKIQNILKKYKVKGHICFADIENVQKIWGYKFDGKGGMVKLTGKITYYEIS